VNEGNNLFSDRTVNFNLGLIGFHYSGWGTKLVDFDNDGWLDLFITNGHTMEQLEKYFPADPFAEPNYVLQNIDGKKFVDVSAISGLRNVPNKVGRGTAFGDFDNDGNVVCWSSIRTISPPCGGITESRVEIGSPSGLKE